MEINIIAIGKIKANDYLQKLIDEYLKRTRWKVNFHISEVDNSGEQNKFFEKYLLKGFNFILDENGKNFSTNEFSNKIIDLSINFPNINFFIGGADGFDNYVKEKAHCLMSFGRLTWPHKMVRLMLVEQIYRAYTIYNNHPYHRN